MMERLWGDNFFDPKSKKWTKKHTGTDTCQWVPSLPSNAQGAYWYWFTCFQPMTCSCLCWCAHLLCRRGFVQFVYSPIKTLIECCMADDRVKLWKLTDSLGVTGKLKSEDKDLVSCCCMTRCAAF